MSRVDKDAVAVKEETGCPSTALSVFSEKKSSP